jgi:predicted ferric reductase
MRSDRATEPALRRRFSWAEVLWPVALGSVAVVIAMWAVDSGAQRLVDGQTSLDSLGLLTGLVSSDLLLIQVIMMARIPWVERAWGHDLLARRHGSIGFVSFWLMIAHVLAFALVRLSGGSRSTLHVLWQVFVRDPWMVWASIGTVLLVVVVITSIRAARRRLRYESWHLLHLCAYVGVAFALPHQIIDGPDFRSPLRQVYWWGLYAAAAGAIVVYRIAQPAWRSWFHRLRVAEVTPEAPGIVSVVVTGRDLGRLHTRSGQFFIWRFLDGPGWTRGHPYTISAAPADDRLRVTIRADGDGSGRAGTLRVGVRVLIEGPYGTMTAAVRGKPRLLLMAAGIGITPIRALLEDTPYAPGETTLIYRISQPGRAIFADEITEIAAERGVEVHWLVGPRRADGSWQGPSVGGTGQRGEVEGVDDTVALRRLVPDLDQRDVFVCGPPAWTSAVRRAARANGVPREYLHIESFTW